MNFLSMVYLLIISTIMSLLPQYMLNNHHNQQQASNYNSHDTTTTTPEEEVPICGGFITIDEKISVQMRKELDYSSITVRSYTSDMIMKEQTNLAQSGYYFLPVYEKESFIIKISGFNGISFEPEQFVFNVNDDKRIEDICKEDINFKFTGFIVEGQISTFGSVDGPEGVNILVHDTEGNELQNAFTVEKGMFKFKPLFPGSYILKPAEKVEVFDPNHSSLEFKVNINQANFLERALIIRGYKVSGKVEAEGGEPLEKVLVIVYSYNSTLTNDYNFQHYKLENKEEYLYKNMLPFCAILTDNTGHFTFNNIPFGNFFIKSVYKDENIFFDIEPEQLEIEVQHKDLVLANSFQVVNFSIYGRVSNNLSNGIPNVTIKIDGQVKAITDTKGKYLLERLVAGNYDLEAQADDIFFEPLTNIRLTALTKSLPDLLVTDYKLCGKIQIEANEYFSNSKRTIVLQLFSEKSTQKERRTITDSQGRYCFEVKPGKYHIFPVLTKEEKDSELHLNPEYIDIEVIDRPLLEINFYQSKVEITGTIKCIESPCDSDMKVFLVSMKSEKLISTNLEDSRSADTKEFAFRDILSGQYKLYVRKHEWCWEQEEVQIKVQNTNIKDLVFKQSGFSLFYHSNHNIDIEWENKDKKLSSQKTTLMKNKSKICLPYKGEYKIIPKSCQKFKEEYYMYSTEKYERLTLTPDEFLVKGNVILNNKVLQKFKSNLKDLQVDIVIEKLKAQNLDNYKTITQNTNDKINLFEFYTKPRTNLIITPEINKKLLSVNKTYETLLFQPKFKQIRVEENCLENVEELKFEMRSGLIIKGKINPPMDGINVSAYNKDNNELISSAVTDANGDYKIGPLYTEYKYNVKALKDGYKIVSTPENPYIFNAEKLSFLRVKVIDTNGKPLSSVFLSLSSADRGFKINNNTNAEGYYDFFELYSGDYYIMPLFKEYKFEPNQKLVKIEGGMHYEETIISHRVAFSIFGKSKYLNYLFLFYSHYYHHSYSFIFFPISQ